MNRELRIGLTVLIINTLICLIYLIVNMFFRKEHAGSYMLRFWVMLVCPVVGPVFFFFGWLYFKLFMNEPVDLEDVIFSKERVKTYRKADEARERNFVSLEEAMAVSDKASTRELMLDLVRRDIRESLHTIAMALNSEDTEISHYAASVLQETLNTFRVNVQKLYRTILEMREEDENEENRGQIVLFCRELIGSLDSVLKQKVLSPMEQETYVTQMAEVMNILREYEVPEPEMFEAMAMRFLDVKDYIHCEEWCDILMKTYPDILSSYTCKLKLYYTVHDRDRFFETMDALKHSDVIVDSETLKMIRTFS